MSGIALSSALRSLLSNSYTVNVDDGGIFGLGYSGPNSLGTLSPNTNFRGTTIQTVLSPSISGGDVAIQILGTLRQDFFERIVIQNNAGGLVTLFSNATATFTAGASTTWIWTSAGEIWTIATIGLNRSLQIFYRP